MCTQYNRHSQARGFSALLMVLLAVLPVSCTRFLPPLREAPLAPIPEQFTLYEAVAPASGPWWSSFKSEQLNHLIDTALNDNLSLQQLYARLEQVQMLARQASAARLPVVDAQGSTSISQRRIDTGESPSQLAIAAQKAGALNTLTSPVTITSTGLGAVADGASALQRKGAAASTLLTEPPSSSNTATSHNYGLGLSSSYEVDLWGRVRAQHESALLNLEASREDIHAAMLSLSGAITRQWLQIVALHQELDLVQEQLDLNQTTRELMELRYRKGLATMLDVLQQRQIVAQTESLIPPLESSLQTAKNELAVLIGAAPQTDLGIKTAALPEGPALPDPGVPADLLARRPDIRAAGLQLAAADWRVSAARADRLPALRLSASAGYSATEWDLILSNWAMTLAGSLTGPVFDAGRRKAEVARTRAVAHERLASYKETVLNALLEVENGLVQESKQAAYIAALERELEVVRNSHEQALERYRKGLNDYLPVLSALNRVQVLERQLVRARLARLSLLTQLNVALGGDWMPQALSEQHINATEGTGNG